MNKAEFEKAIAEVAERLELHLEQQVDARLEAEEQQEQSCLDQVVPAAPQVGKHGRLVGAIPARTNPAGNICRTPLARGYTRGMKFAITRDVSLRIGNCELAHLERVPIDLGRARQQHDAYCGALSELGWTIIRLPASPDLPDSVFVEDTAVVTDEAAILTNPGATSRRPEIAPIAEVLGKFRTVAVLRPPATLDGGDVLFLGRDVWVGVGARSNEQAIEVLRAILQPYGLAVRAAQPRGCLHLKSAITRAGPDCLIVNPNWIEPQDFSGWRIIEVDPQEPFAANVLWLGEVTLAAKAYPRTRDRIEAHGLKCRTLDMSELAKAEGGLTCCSILFDA